MTKTHLERFDEAYNMLNGLGAATKSVDVTEALGFAPPNERVTMMTSPDGHPRKDGYRAIGWLMTNRYVDTMVAGKAVYMVNALCGPDGEVTSIYADKADAYTLEIGVGVNHGYPMTERTVPDQTMGVESALVLIEQGLQALTPLREQ